MLFSALRCSRAPQLEHWRSRTVGRRELLRAASGFGSASNATLGATCRMPSDAPRSDELCQVALSTVLLLAFRTSRSQTVLRMNVERCRARQRGLRCFRPGFGSTRRVLPTHPTLSDRGITVLYHFSTRAGGGAGGRGGDVSVSRSHAGPAHRPICESHALFPGPNRGRGTLWWRYKGDTMYHISIRVLCKQPTRPPTGTPTQVVRRKRCGSHSLMVVQLMVEAITLDGE